MTTGQAPAAAAGGDLPALDALLARYAGGRAIRPDTTIDELGLSSLERVELMVALEQKFQAPIDEARFAGAHSVADLRTLLAEAPAAGRPSESWTMPSWNRSWPVRLLRNASLGVWLLPLTRLFAWLRVTGREHLDRIQGPVIFAANHQSHMDTPVILAALPWRWRTRLAVAMAKEFFAAHFHPAEHGRGERVTNGLNYSLAATFFNAFPLPQREAGARHTLRYAGDLVTDGWSILIFPEGGRTEEGEIGQFRAGVGMMASRLRVPVVPVRLEGVDRVLHRSWKMARPGRVRVAFGRPLTLTGEDYAALAHEVEQAVRAL